MIFPDYIYNSIISLTIEHLFNNNTNLEVFHIEQFNSYKTNEVVKLSLVNKKWFEMVSLNLESVLSFKNFKSLKKLIALPPKIKNNDQVINNKKRKYSEIQDDGTDNNGIVSEEDIQENEIDNSGNDEIIEEGLKYSYDSEDEEEAEAEEEIEEKEIKLNNQTIKNQFKIVQNHNLVKVYSTIQEYIRNKVNSLNTNKILIEPYGNVSIELVSTLSNNNNRDKRIEPNCEVDLWLSFDEGPEIEEFLSDSKFNGISNKVNRIYLKVTDGPDINHSLLNKIITVFNPKRIEYFRNEVSLNTHSILFEANSLESLEFSNYYNFSEPKDVAKINNQHTKLKSLSISCLFNSISRFVNDCPATEDSDVEDEEADDSFVVCDYYKFKKEEFEEEQFIENTSQDEIENQQVASFNIKEEWISMFKVLANNSTIKDLVLSEPCVYSFCRSKCVNNYSVDRSFVSSGLASIFTSPLSKIENLVLDGLDYDNPIFLSSLANNKTIKTLLLFSMDNVTPFFYKVLAKNNTIRNVLIGRKIKINYLELLLSTPGLNLYSLTVRVQKYDNIFSLINSLLNNNNHEPSISNINIKELTIYTSNQTLLNSSRLKSRYVLNNSCSTIINIVYAFDECPLSTSFR